MQANQRENKIKTVIIDSPQQKLYALSLVGEIPVDGTQEVVFKNVDTSYTAKQNRLRWLWSTEVSRSGLGSNDTKTGVDLTAKWAFARPIWLRDCEMFSEIYNHFMKTVRGSDRFSEYCKQFAGQYISVSRMTKRQSWEYLTDFEKFWNSKGLALTDPRDCGLNRDKLAKLYLNQGE